MLAVLTQNDLIFFVWAGEARTIAGQREKAAWQTATETKPYCVVHSALRRERLPRLSHGDSFYVTNCVRTWSSFWFNQSFESLRFW